MTPITIRPGAMTLADWRAIYRGRGCALDPAARPAVARAAEAVAAIVARGEPVYGVNTGFGKLSTVRIADADLATLQRNLVLSHAAGVGEPTPAPVVRLMMALKLAGLGQGTSGVRPETLDLKAGDRIGQAAEGKLPMANGHEFDVRPSTLAALQEQPPPAGTQVPPDPPNMHRLANGIIPWKKGGAAFDYFFRPIKPKTDQGGEMIYWERPEGGRVFNAGTIGFGWALLADSKL